VVVVFCDMVSVSLRLRGRRAAVLEQAWKIHAHALSGWSEWQKW